LDELEEQARGERALGTTRKGVGPAYVDKAARVGIRLGDLLEYDFVKERLSSVLETKNAVIQSYGKQPLILEEIFERYLDYGRRLARYIQPTELLLQEALAGGKRLLLEGSQGTMLDLDHGTYPFVTSSSASVGGACTGLGLSPRTIAGVVGVFKAYCTRVGGGPLPTEMEDEMGDFVRHKAWEYGATTGRPRRCGWFDGVAAKYSAMINGFTTLVITRLDVLDGLQTVKLCTGYELDGKVVTSLPSSGSSLERCLPIYEELPGWAQPTAGVTNIDELPKAARHYVERIQELVGCPVDLISTGPKREETILIKHII